MMSKIILLIILPFCVQAYTWAQKPELTVTPYWIKAMDEDRANYVRALFSFREFWEGKIIPVENFYIPLETKSRKRHQSFPASTDTDQHILLKLQARRFRRWALINRPFTGSDGRLPSVKSWETKALRKPASRQFGISADWKPIGPNSAIMDPLPQESRIGRMVQLKFHPHDPMIVYAISGSGGLFISKDHGLTWSVLGTDVLPFTYQPSSVCIDYTDDEILYLGMGDPNYGSQGHGVWKSIDGGNAWFNSSGEIGNRLVYDVLMSPAEHTTLNASADRGIWRSVDGGQHWVQTLTLNNDAILDMVYKPGSTDTLYAASFSRFYRSVDDGLSWKQITSGIDMPPGGGRGMRLAVSAANPDMVYLGMFSYHGSVFKSTDSGTNFQLVYRDTVHQSLTTITGIPGGDSNGQYNFSMVADPLDPDVVYFGTQTLWKSTDGGKHWTSLYPYLYRVHPDIHDLEFSPLDHSLFNVNDGGIASSPDGGLVWYQRNDGIVSAEIYNGGQSPIRHDMMIIGTQDNGALGFRKNKWAAIEHGDVYDGFYFDYHTSDKYYSDNGYAKAMEHTENYNLNFPLSTPGARKYAFTPADSNIAFLSQNEVWRCMNINSSSPQWIKISEALSPGNGDYIRDMQVSLVDANDLYIVLANGIILHSRNALDIIPTYDTIAAPAPSTYYQTSITVSSRNPDILYFTSWSDIYRSLDSGLHWELITDNLPEENIYKVIHDGFEPNESIYVLCGNTVYYRNDSIGTWIEYGQGLPSLAHVSDLQVFNDGSRQSVLRAITYGRGVFASPFYKNDVLPSCDFVADSTLLCPEGHVIFNSLAEDADSWYWEFEGGIPASFDGPVPPPVSYSQPGRYSVKLSVSNSDGQADKTKKDYIHVRPHFRLPYSEGFEQDFPPDGITIKSLSPNQVKWYLAQLGAFNLSDQCAVFADNYSFSKSAIQWAVDLSASNEASLTFDVAYAKRVGNVAFDSLEVEVSTDCGKTFTTVYKLGGSVLATMPDIENPLSFNPTADHWRTEHIDLAPFCGHRHVEISMQAFGGAGEIMVVDNLNIRSMISGYKTAANEQLQILVSPNPVTNVVDISGLPSGDKLILIVGQGGEILIEKKISDNEPVHQISMANQLAGVYIVCVISDNGSASRMLIKR